MTEESFSVLDLQGLSATLARAFGFSSAKKVQTKIQGTLSQGSIERSPAAATVMDLLPWTGLHPSEATDAQGCTPAVHMQLSLAG
jgi:hypothetical protein